MFVPSSVSGVYGPEIRKQLKLLANQRPSVSWDIEQVLGFMELEG